MIQKDLYTTLDISEFDANAFDDDKLIIENDHTSTMFGIKL